MQNHTPTNIECNPNVEYNHLGQAVGPLLATWQAPKVPGGETLIGQYCRLVPLAAEHSADLFAANADDAEGRMWTYLPYGPFADQAAYTAWVSQPRAPGLVLYAILDAHGQRALGVAGYLRIDPNAGSIEVGHLAFSPRLQGTTAATEALYLMIRHAFGLGYRRCEWKCNTLNVPSRRAAQRLGFAFEGVFRQATIMQGRSRDTAWFGMIDREWPQLEAVFTRWLAAENFDAAGKQRLRLSALTAPLLHRVDTW